MSLPLSVSALLDRLAARLFPAHENQQGRRGRHGILPPLLVVLTFVTGLVDAVSYLGLDRVFVANMTGNVVFVGFALAGDTRLSAAASLLAVSAFFAGALAGGRFAARGSRIRWSCSRPSSAGTPSWWPPRWGPGWAGPQPIR